MAFNKIGLEFYRRHNQCSSLIPLHAWNILGVAPKDKKGKPRLDKDGNRIKGKPLGKAPRHDEWPTKEYDKDAYHAWIKKGFNLGYRIPSNEIVIDMDPRNYKSEHGLPVNTELLILDLFGCSDMEDLSWSYPVCKTGGGGYHIYTTLPDGYDYRMLREVTKALPGVEFKKKGKQVVCAGSRHPDSTGPEDKIYQYVSDETVPIDQIPLALLDMIKVDKNLSNSDDPFRILLKSDDLHDHALLALDVTNFRDHDSWRDLMFACHYATGGEGVEVFINWSTSDPDYEYASHIIRQRWQSLSDKPGALTERSLVHIIKEEGESYKALENLLDYGATLSNDNGKEEEFLSSCAAAVDDELDGIMPEKKDPTVSTGDAIKACRALKKGASSEEKMKAVRLMVATTDIEKADCREWLTEQGIMKEKYIKEREKAIAAESEEVGGEDSIPEIVVNTALKNVFNKGKHIMTEPDDQTYTFEKTHWQVVSKKYLAMGSYRIVDTLKRKYGLTMPMPEMDIAKKAAEGLSIRNVSRYPVLQTTVLKPIINCLNRELHMHDDGTFTAKEHDYNNHLTAVLNVAYDPKAECPLFDSTIKEIFSKLDDGDEVVDLMSEVFGYTLQPLKDIACWWLLLGEGGDGKSTLLKILGAMLGDYQLNTSVKVLSLGSDTSNNHAYESIVGKLAVIIEELPCRYPLPETGLKMLSEGASMESNPKYGRQFKFEYAATLFMCANTFPTVKELSKAMDRRAHVIPFNREFNDTDTADVKRVETIVRNPKEMSGILNWMLRGYARLRKRGGFKLPTSCASLEKEWMIGANNVSLFMSEHVVVDRDNPNKRMCKAMDLHITYTIWCKDRDMAHKKETNFYEDLKALRISCKAGKGGVKQLYGGSLVEIDVTDFDDDGVL